jgi:glutaredoxin
MVRTVDVVLMADGMSGVRLELLSRAQCHLCDAARTSIARVAAELGVDWTERDIDADPELAREFTDYVPVIVVDGRVHGYWRVEEDRLRRALGAR